MKKKLSILLFAALCALSLIFVSCTSDEGKTYPVEFSLSDITAKGGETVSLELTVSSTAIANAFALHELVYDGDVLEFVGFAELGDAGKKSIFGDMGLDSNDKVISILLTDAEVLTGKICEVRFKVKEGAKAGTTAVSMKSVVKNTNTPIESVVRSGSVTVGG